MEVENISSIKMMSDRKDGEDDDDVQLPGFRFHPTDEELVGFYLRRKVEKRPISIELIKHADIYKYDPWDLPKSGNVGDKEWYFFCKRGRKYRNSVRPNRVTSSGFWKATGIDKPIYSSAGSEPRDHCIGLKKSLVYYRGCAGKGTKTDWMMHEFRLPPSNSNDKSSKHVASANKSTNTQEAEVWTLCRVLKRNVSYRKCLPDNWRDKTCTTTNSSDHHLHQNTRQNMNSYNISFNTPIVRQLSTDHHHDNKKPYSLHADYHHHQTNITNQQHFPPGNFSSSPTITSQSAPILSADNSPFSSSLTSCDDINELLRHADWEDLRSIVDCAAGNLADPFYF